jgi:hypothetical protein
MKTYDDLVFVDHMLAIEAKQHADICPMLYSESRDAKHAVLMFDNGYGISVIKDCPFLTGTAKYECAVIHGTAEKYNLVYPKFAPDVVRLNTIDDINKLMAKIQKIKANK